MYRSSFSLAVALLTFSNLSLYAAGDAEPVHHFLSTYCNDCHGAEKQKGDRRFDQLALPVSKVDTLIELKDILDQINLGDMPPKKSKQPTSEEQKAFIEQLTKALTHGREALASTGGSTVLRRLNRTEYLRTIGDLFELNMAAFDPTTKFPRDQSAEHMENLGDVLQTSGYLLDQYLDAADAVVEKVFAQQKPVKEQAWHFTKNFRSDLKRKEKDYNNAHLLVEECMDSDKHTAGFGVIEDFVDGVPADGFYEVQVLVKAMNREHPYEPKWFGTDPREPFRLGIVPGNAKVGPLDLPQPQQPMLAEVALDDADAKWITMKIWLDTGHTPRFVFPNGPEDARGTWFKIAEQHKDLWDQFMDEDDKQKGKLGIVAARQITLHVHKHPHIRIDEVKIRGPIAETWPPASQQTVVGKQAFQAEKIWGLLQTFSDRAYRRKATEDEMKRLMAVVDKRMQQGLSPLNGFKAALKAALCSPGFVYLSQETQDGSNKLSSNALASRLSYFLWSTMPDAELMSQDLTKPEVLLAQTRRMLKDKRSDAFVAGFLDSWLNLRNLGSMPPDRGEFEEYYSKGFQEAFKVETRMFMRDLIERDASLVNFLDRDRKSTRLNSSHT